MLWHSLGTAAWFPIVVAATAFAGRIAKAAWKTMPPPTLPVMALGGGYAIVFVDLALDATDPLSRDATLALWGVLLGGAATGAHESAKKLLEAVLGRFLSEGQATAIAEIILGKLEAKATPPKSRRATVTIGSMVLACALCGPVLSGCATVASVLSKAAQALPYITQVVDEIQRRADQADLSDEDRAKLDRSLEATRTAMRALGAASAAGEAHEAGDAEARRNAVLQSYEETYRLATQLGVLDAGALGAGDGEALGAAEGGIPTPEELRARL